MKDPREEIGTEVCFIVGTMDEMCWTHVKKVNHFSTTGLQCCDHCVRHSQRLCKKIDCATSNQDFNSTT